MCFMSLTRQKSMTSICQSAGYRSFVFFFASAVLRQVKRSSPLLAIDADSVLGPGLYPCSLLIPFISPPIDEVRVAKQGAPTLALSDRNTA
jgi:hypothetical protein